MLNTLFAFPTQPSKGATNKGLREGKISTEDFSDETLAIDDTCGDDVKEIVVLVDKVADEVTDSEVDKVADMKIPIEDLTEVILEIGD